MNARKAPRGRRDHATDGRRNRHGVDGLPLWQQLVRKAVGMWPDQIETLTRLRIRLQSRRTDTSGDRITDATVVRIGVDLVEVFADELAGDEERELSVSGVAVATDLLDARDLLRKALPDAPGDASTVSLVKLLLHQRKSAE